MGFLAETLLNITTCLIGRKTNNMNSTQQHYCQEIKNKLGEASQLLGLLGKTTEEDIEQVESVKQAKEKLEGALNNLTVWQLIEEGKGVARVELPKPVSTDDGIEAE